MKVGLIGATGLVGSHALTLLLADDSIDSVRVWARREAPLQDAKLEWQQVDFEQLADLADCSGLDAVLCALGTTQGKAGKQGLLRVDHDYVVAIALAAAKAQVASFCLVSALGASEKSPSYYSRVKAQAEQAVRAMNFTSLEILRPSLLLGERDDSRPAEAVGQKLAPLLNSLLCGPLKPYRAIAGSDVASAMIQLAKNQQAGQHVRLLPLANSNK
ncbi:MAG: NAD(P)H-binding protein [Oceanococcus sp.]